MDFLLVDLLEEDDPSKATETYWLIKAFELFNSTQLVNDPKSNTAVISITGALSTNLDQVDAETVIVYDLFHYDSNYNNYYNKIINQNPNKKIKCLTNNFNLNEVVEADVIEWDYLFNRTKMIYTEKHRLSSKRSDLQYYEPYSAYELTPIRGDKIHKHFLSLARSMTGFRPRLLDHLIKNFESKGIIGCQALGKIIENERKGYTPLSQAIYDQTFCSIYVESTIDNAISFVTEKTFEPLIKGNFVLPFSDANFINTLESRYGFSFPDIIDYTYGDDFDKFLRSIDRLCSQPIRDLRDYYINNIHLLESNRQVFFDRPYHTVDLNLLG